MISEGGCPHPPEIRCHPDSVRRVSQETADKRNRWILENSDDIFFGAIDPAGTLAQLASHPQKCSENYGFKV